MRRGLRVLAVAGVLVLTACGVRPESAPHRLDEVTAAPSSGPIARPSGITVYLVRDGRLAPVRRLVVAPPTPAGRLASLTRGPDDRESADGLTTALGDLAGGEPVVRDGVVTVPFAAALGSLPRDRQALAAAQVVFTLTEDGDVRGVRFAVGRGPAGPVRTRADYAPLRG